MTEISRGLFFVLFDRVKMTNIAHGLVVVLFMRDTNDTNHTCSLLCYV